MKGERKTFLVELIVSFDPDQQMNEKKVRELFKNIASELMFSDFKVVDIDAVEELDI
jgi:hypothetical protein